MMNQPLICLSWNPLIPTQMKKGMKRIQEKEVFKIIFVQRIKFAVKLIDVHEQIFYCFISVLGRKGNKLHKSRDKKHRRPDDYVPREGEIAYGSWDRGECFKVERGLLTFGWGRWQECLANSQFRKGWTDKAFEDCARVIVSFYRFLLHLLYLVFKCRFT